MKLVGLLLVVLCGFGSGALAAGKLRQESTAAVRICQLLREWSVQMAFRCSSVPELLEQTEREAAYHGFGFPAVMLQALAEGQPVSSAWQIGIQQENLLTEPLKQLLLPLGDELGTSDLEGQLETLEQYRRHAASLADELRQKSAPKQRLYLTMGALGGIMAAILLC